MSRTVAEQSLILQSGQNFHPCHLHSDQLFFNGVSPGSGCLHYERTYQLSPHGSGPKASPLHKSDHRGFCLADRAQTRDFTSTDKNHEIADIFSRSEDTACAIQHEWTTWTTPPSSYSDFVSNKSEATRYRNRTNWSHSEFSAQHVPQIGYESLRHRERTAQYESCRRDIPSEQQQRMTLPNLLFREQHILSRQDSYESLERHHSSLPMSQSIAAHISSASEDSIESRFNLSGPRPWTPESDEVIRRAVGEARKINQAVDWARVAPGLGRSRIQCQVRWTEVLDPSIKKGNGLLRRTVSLRSAYASHGAAWNKIAALLVSRTQHQCRSRWLQMRHQESTSNVLSQSGSKSTT